MMDDFKMTPLPKFDSKNPNKLEESTMIGKWKDWWTFLSTVTRVAVDSNEVRCPVSLSADKMREVSVK